MKTFLLAAFTLVLWVAVFGAGLRACDAEADAREAMDACLATSDSPFTCMDGE